MKIYGNPKASSIPPLTIGNFAGVYKLFEKAKLKIKNPAIKLALPDGSPLELVVAGSKSAVPNVVNLSDGKGYGKGYWYGRVFPDGVWKPSADAHGKGLPFLNSVAALLTEFAKNPASTAMAYGKATNHCCFCGLTLTEAHSVAAGFGPVCAENYGLSMEWKAAFSGKAPLKSLPDVVKKVSVDHMMKDLDKSIMMAMPSEVSAMKIESGLTHADIDAAKAAHEAHIASLVEKKTAAIKPTPVPDKPKEKPKYLF